jgi:hypothetical protein
MISQEDISEFIFEYKKELIISVILIIVLIIIIVYLTTDFSHSRIYNKQQLFYNDEEIIVGFEDIQPSKENIRSTFSIFIRLNNLSGNTDWNKDQSFKKYIIDNSGSPNIVYYRETGDVVVEVAYKNEDGINENYEFNLKKFPMQKWVGLCIVTDDRIVKIYLDGKLHTAKKLNTVPFISKKMLNIGKNTHNFNGNIGMIDYYNRVLKDKEVLNLYNKRIKSLPTEVLTYEQAEYKRKKNKELQTKLTTIKKF